MAPGATLEFRIAIVPARSLSSQPWWPQLHQMINETYQVKNVYVFPASWTRLDPDPAKGAEDLANELGESGHLAVAFTNDKQPVACGGALPFRGENWINEAFRTLEAELSNGHSGSNIIADWETCCFCVHPSARRNFLPRRVLNELSAFLKARGGERLFCNYARDETGDFWPRLGFEIVPGAGGKLSKGLKTKTRKQGLKADICFSMGVKTL